MPNSCGSSLQLFPSSLSASAFPTSVDWKAPLYGSIRYFHFGNNRRGFSESSPTLPIASVDGDRRRNWFRMTNVNANTANPTVKINGGLNRSTKAHADDAPVRSALKSKPLMPKTLSNQPYKPCRNSTCSPASRARLIQRQSFQIADSPLGGETRNNARLPHPCQVRANRPSLPSAFPPRARKLYQLYCLGVSNLIHSTTNGQAN